MVRKGGQEKGRWWEGSGLKDFQNQETQGMGKAQGAMRDGKEEKNVLGGRKGARKNITSVVFSSAHISRVFGAQEDLKCGGTV